MEFIVMLSVCKNVVIWNAGDARKDAGAEFRHDMRPSIQLPSVSVADSKLGLTMVCSQRLNRRRSPPVNMTPDCCGVFWRPATLNFDRFNWKLALHLLVS